MKIIAFFNSKGGVGKTALVYHLASMYAQLRMSVLAVDLDPQANLTCAFLPEERLEELWPEGRHPLTIHGAVEPVMSGLGDVADPHVEEIDSHLGLVPGDLALCSIEDILAKARPLSEWSEGDNSQVTAFHRAIARAARSRQAELVLADVGPGLGAISRSAVMAADDVVIPIAPDLFALQSLRGMGPRLREWRASGQELRPLGYVVMQHAVRRDRPAGANMRWMNEIPAEYRRSILATGTVPGMRSADDEHCLAALGHYRSLLPLAEAARKPMFLLKPADGAIGAHGDAVRDCYREFESLANKIAGLASRDR
ncbi:MAG: ParA family protein [Bryobacteraceae bacterium]